MTPAQFNCSIMTGSLWLVLLFYKHFKGLVFPITDFWGQSESKIIGLRFVLSDSNCNF